MEWLHDWNVFSKRIVQKYTIEVLNVDRNALIIIIIIIIIITIIICPIAIP